MSDDISWVKLNFIKKDAVLFVKILKKLNLTVKMEYCRLLYRNFLREMSAVLIVKNSMDCRRSWKVGGACMYLRCGAAHPFFFAQDLDMPRKSEGDPHRSL